MLKESVKKLLRPWVIRLRHMAHRFWGVQVLSINSDLKLELPVGEAFHRVMDRICLLETQVNWRLLGLPQRVANIQLEHLAILGDQLPIRDALQKAEWLSVTEDQMELNAFNDFVSRLCRQEGDKLVVCGSMALVRSWNQFNCSEFKVDWIDDTEDLYLPLWEDESLEGVRRLRVPLLSYLAGAQGKNICGVWVSRHVSWQHPLKTIVTINQWCKMRRAKAELCGMLPVDQSLDIRVLRPTGWFNAWLASIDHRVDGDSFSI
jgi:hypothetical protein